MGCVTVEEDPDGGGAAAGAAGAEAAVVTVEAPVFFPLAFFFSLVTNVECCTGDAEEAFAEGLALGLAAATKAFAFASAAAVFTR